VTEKTDGLWTKEDVAAYLGVSVHSIYKMTAPKARLRIPHVRVGGLKFRKADIDRWLDLISVSNMDILEKARRKARKTYGNHPQEEAP
jgi:excisionase family DNA binding protein